MTDEIDFTPQSQERQIARLTALIDTAIDRIESGEATDDECLGAYDRWGLLKQLVTAFNKRFENAMLIRLAEHDLEWGDGRRLYVTPNKTTKSRDNKATMAALLDTTGGDVDAMVECLASQPFKHGTIRQIINDEAAFEALFETTVTSKTAEGKAQNKIQAADKRFGA
jgi:hypothetical protein